MVNFKNYEFTDWTKNNTIHLLPNISRSKGNQIMRFGQLKEYNNIFLEKSYKQCDGETSFRPFYLELV